jgi:hypothetical protein
MNVLIDLWFRNVTWHWGIIEGKAFSDHGWIVRTLFFTALFLEATTAQCWAPNA